MYTLPNIKFLVQRITWSFATRATRNRGINNIEGQK